MIASGACLELSLISPTQREVCRDVAENLSITGGGKQARSPDGRKSV